MTPEFDIQLTDKDLFRFNLRQNYTTMQGPFSIVIAILFAVASVFSYKNGSVSYGLLCDAAAVLFLIYIPITLKLRSKRTMKKNAVLSGVLHYAFTDHGISVSANGETGELPYDQVYKLVTTKKQLLIFSNRINAYIIPLEQLGDKYEAVKKTAIEKIPDYRRKLK